MGGGPSKPETLTEEWRSVLWGHRETDLRFLKMYQPHNDEVQQLRVLLCGPVGSGKSTFINSVESVYEAESLVELWKVQPWKRASPKNTKRTNSRKENQEHFTLLPSLTSWALTRETNRGVAVEDLKLAMKGHIKDGYTFNPCSKISEDNQYYNKTPTLKDQVHVLVCVISATTSSILSDETVKKTREVRLAARDMGIPQLAILTKIDEACPEVKTDIRNVYKSKYLKEKITELNATLGIAPKYIFPVKNYHSEIYTNDDTDTLILSALKRMIADGEDFVNS